MNCPYCGSTNPETAQECSCGYNFIRITKPTPQPPQKPASEWRVKIQDSEYFAENVNILKEWVRTGKVLPEHYVYNPVLEKWMYIRDLEEVRSFVPSAFPQTVKSRVLYIVLGLFLGCLGIHNFYAGYHSRGFAQLLITLLLGWLFFGFVLLTVIWSFIEILTIKYDASGHKMV